MLLSLCNALFHSSRHRPAPCNRRHSSKYLSCRTSPLKELTPKWHHPHFLRRPCSQSILGFSDSDSPSTVGTVPIAPAASMRAGGSGLAMGCCWNLIGERLRERQNGCPPGGLKMRSAWRSRKMGCQIGHTDRDLTVGTRSKRPESWARILGPETGPKLRSSAGWVDALGSGNQI